MKEEYLDIFDEKMNLIGSEARSVVHKKGYWHQTFQTWFYFEKENTQYVYLQKRHENKDVGAGLFDITAAGHISSGETIKEGAREIQEELGVLVSYDRLIPLGVLRQTTIEENIVDREFCNVFIYKTDIKLYDFNPQEEEVSGIVSVEVQDFFNLVNGTVDLVCAHGFEISDSGERHEVYKCCGLKDFVPHGREYYNHVLEAIIKQKTI